MHWIAPSEKNSANGSLEKSLWEAADQFRANSGLKSQEYSAPVLQAAIWAVAEPESSLNTVLEAQAAYLLSRMAKEDNGRLQILATTHSDLMIQYASFLSESGQSACPRPWSIRQLSRTFSETIWLISPSALPH